jgi:hypothetical protein
MKEKKSLRLIWERKVRRMLLKIKFETLWEGRSFKSIS